MLSLLFYFVIICYIIIPYSRTFVYEQLLQDDLLLGGIYMAVETIYQFTLPILFSSWISIVFFFFEFLYIIMYDNLQSYAHAKYFCE